MMEFILWVIFTKIVSKVVIIKKIVIILLMIIIDDYYWWLLLIIIIDDEFNMIEVNKNLKKNENKNEKWEMNDKL